MRAPLMLLLGAASCSGCCCFCVVTRNLPMAAYLPPAPSDIFVPEVAEKRINPRKVSHLPQVTIITGGIGPSEVFPSKSAPQRLGGPPNASTEYNGLHKNTRRDCKRKNTRGKGTHKSVPFSPARRHISSTPSRLVTKAFPFTRRGRRKVASRGPVGPQRAAGTLDRTHTAFLQF